MFIDLLTARAGRRDRDRDQVEPTFLGPDTCEVDNPFAVGSDDLKEVNHGMRPAGLPARE
jgi:hypothetical protein